jgi:hypothetical protein
MTFTNLAEQTTECFQNVLITPGHKYYFAEYMKSNYSADGMWLVDADPNSSMEKVFHDGSGNYKLLSLVFNPSGTNVMIRILDTTRGGDISVNPVKIKQVMAIDLTETFGAGYEPTQKWCDENLPFVADMGYIAKNPYVPINEVQYDPETWAEWTKGANVTADNTGMQAISDHINYSSVSINTALKASTKYGVLMFVVDKTTSSTIWFDPSGAFAGIPPTNFNNGTGNRKLTVMSASTITNNKITCGLCAPSDIAGKIIKIKDIRMFELPAGSQIEADFNTLTADQLAVKYPF